MAPVPPASPALSVELPNYVLLEVFEYLPGQDLVVASHTCRLWNQIIMARRRLRTNAFTPSSHKPIAAVSDIELHPVLSQVHFDTSLDAKAIEYGVHRAPRKIMDAAVSKQLATSPAVAELRLDVMKYHPHIVVQNADGVRVADVIEELTKYKSVATNFTFEDFFGREMCSQRGYERRKRMRRVDMVGEEKVLVTFAPGVSFNNSVLFEAVRFKSVGAARAPNSITLEKDSVARHDLASPSSSSSSTCSSSSSYKYKDGYRFWSAFAFEGSPACLSH